ncbi:type VI secretion system Vgr family protein [Alsobacter sp. SYSU BS001988]|jgi:type VI secretion system secreted protein VgrG
MTDELAQDERVASLQTPLGRNKLAIARFEAHEALSELFEFSIDALSRDPDIDFDKALGRSCCVTIAAYAGPKRHFDGVLVEAQALGMVHDLYSYRLILRPSLWLLSRTANCRIWHDMTALAIIKEVLGQRGVQYKTATTRECRKREYCVQYRETDLAFVSRLMEEEGIYYFFQHADGEHTLYLADAPSSHKPVPGHSRVPFSKVAASGHVREEALFDWTSERRFRTGKFELRDYNFKTPGNKLIGPAKASARYAKSDLEVYDYPGKYDQESEGKRYAEIRRDAEQAFDKRRYASGEAPSLFPGGCFTLADHPKSSENKSFLVLRARHQFSAQTFRSGGAGLGSGENYRGDYEMLPADQQFHAPMVTPKPIVHGPQTARVVARPGTSGEEIDVDDHGRIRVRFHWDRDDKRSCWLRVAQMWAGSRWGGQFIPRIDMEVVVEFLEGDPDRPLVVGSVYNADNRYPWTLPANKTQSGVKTDSSKGHNGHNQVRFEDKKGSEEINVRAEKDLNTEILHAETRKIGERFQPPMGSPSRETTLLMGDDKLTVASGHRQATVAMNDTLTVGMSRQDTVGLNRSASIGVSDSVVVGASQSVTVGAAQSTTVGGAQSTTVGAAQTDAVGAVVTVTAGGVVSITAGGAIMLTAGGGVHVNGVLFVHGAIIPL